MACAFPRFRQLNWLLLRNKSNVLFNVSQDNCFSRQPRSYNNLHTSAKTFSRQMSATFVRFWHTGRYRTLLQHVFDSILLEEICFSFLWSRRSGFIVIERCLRSAIRIKFAPKPTNLSAYFNSKQRDVRWGTSHSGLLFTRIFSKLWDADLETMLVSISC